MHRCQGILKNSGWKQSKYGITRQSWLPMEVLFGLHPTVSRTQKLCWYVRNTYISVRFSSDLAQIGFPFLKDPISIGSNHSFLLQGSVFGNTNAEQPCIHFPSVF